MFGRNWYVVSPLLPIVVDQEQEGHLFVLFLWSELLVSRPLETDTHGVYKEKERLVDQSIPSLQSLPCHAWPPKTRRDFSQSQMSVHCPPFNLRFAYLFFSFLRFVLFGFFTISSPMLFLIFMSCFFALCNCTRCTTHSPIASRPPSPPALATFDNFYTTFVPACSSPRSPLLRHSLRNLFLFILSLLSFDLHSVYSITYSFKWYFYSAIRLKEGYPYASSPAPKAANLKALSSSTFFLKYSALKLTISSVPIGAFRITALVYSRIIFANSG